MATIQTLTKKKTEKALHFAERAARVAQDEQGFVLGACGPLCPTCAPSSESLGDSVDIVEGAFECYNCEDSVGVYYAHMAGVPA